MTIINIVTRHDAHAKGRNKYYTGRPCKNGHLCERYVCNGCCVQCVNWRVSPALNAPNVMMPPSGYAFPGHLAPFITPQILSLVHAEVLAQLNDVLNAVERKIGMYAELRHPYRMTAKAEGRGRGAWIQAGWTDKQLIEAGIIEYVG